MNQTSNSSPGEMERQKKKSGRTDLITIKINSGIHILNNKVIYSVTFIF